MIDDALRAKFGTVAVGTLLARISIGNAPEIEVAALGDRLKTAGSDVDPSALLEAAAEVGIVKRMTIKRCPKAHCRSVLDDEALEREFCPACETDYREEGVGPVPQTVFCSDAPLSRSVPWLIAIHGFNTLAPWQEDFSWRIANRFKYHAPVLIYKYGLIRFSVLVRFRHRALARSLGRRIAAAVIYAEANQITEPPDVVIHSFGSQLFRLVLELPEFSSLRFGRVIAAGSVIRPDFDWSGQIAKGRIEAVLNHTGGRDYAVPFAQFFIPGTGPGGRHGFVDPMVINVKDPKFEHSSCFTAPALEENLRDGGLWDRFLRRPLASFAEQRRFAPSPWKPKWRLVRGLARTISAIALLVTGLLALRWTGWLAVQLLDWLWWQVASRS